MRNIFLLFVTLSMLSCQKVIDINPTTSKVTVIIQAYLYKDSIAFVEVNKSTAYLTQVNPPNISTAVVTLTDNNGVTETLTWNPNTDRHESITMKGVVNNTYTLKVVLEGKTYTSVSVLPDLIPADSITVVHKAKSVFQKEGYYMQLYAHIPTNVDLYYLFKAADDSSFMFKPNEIDLGDNKNLNGNIQGLDMGFQFQPVENAHLYIFSLTKPAYDFYNAASLQLNNDGGFFSTPPANVPSMFDNGAIGLFQCSTIQELSTLVVVQPVTQ